MNKTITFKQVTLGMMALLLSIVAVAFAAGRKADVSAAESKPGVIQPFVIHYTYYKLNGHGPAHELVIKVAGDGRAKTTHYVPQNGTMVAWEPPPEVAAWQYPAITPEAWVNYGSFDALRANEDYVCDNKVLDYEVAILRGVLDGTTNEEWFNPQFGPIPLKTIETLPEGIWITEVTSIEFRQVAPHEVE